LRGEGDGAVNAQRALLKDRAYEQIKELILNWTFTPGTFLSERRLAAQLGMSKTPVRSALERLANEGFVTISPQQGVVVREFSVEEIVDLFDIRIALETFVVKSLANRIDEAYVEKLEENLAGQLETTFNGDYERATVLDTDFHVLLCQALGNREILRTMVHLRDKLYRVVYRVLQYNRQRIATSYEEHRKIAGAIFTGDGETAARLVQEHLEWGKQALVTR
jgi:DNA-binding GntR family transcriptional regulator